MTSAENHTPLEPQARQVLLYWFGDTLEADYPPDDQTHHWFEGGDAVDAHIRERFGDLVAQAVDGGLQHWENDLRHRMALIILLDQFTRNVYRGEGQAFAGDERARRLSLRTIDSGEHEQLPRVGRVFLYLPLMHAEDAALQAQCVALFEALVAGAPEPLATTLSKNVHFARLHEDIIRRFGRFPYRNAALGRENTAEEAVFIKDGPRFGQ
ncbi:DUF924 family protein [Hydrogenophaga sp. 5NK40-0174]|uniref:DUF924 family protein n=1 Tax=Hydrogenophaga sp. 5NK40-0174 TaxID=3127649 RepID=UPI003108C37C